MTWTTEKPTAPGWYWYREAGQADTIFKVNEACEMIRRDDERNLSLKSFDGQFSGPIPEPEEPKFIHPAMSDEDAKLIESREYNINEVAKAFPLSAQTINSSKSEDFTPGYIKNPKGHVWELNAEGQVDDLAYDVVDEDGEGHNGPRCSKCGYMYCMWCDHDGPPESCPA